jgi:hypothetical protein
MLVRPDPAHRALLLQLHYRYSVNSGSRAEFSFRFHGWTLLEFHLELVLCCSTHHQLELSRKLDSASSDCGHSCRWSVHYLVDRSYLLRCDLSGRKLPSYRWLPSLTERPRHPALQSSHHNVDEAYLCALKPPYNTRLQMFSFVIKSDTPRYLA